MRSLPLGALHSPRPPSRPSSSLPEGELGADAAVGVEGAVGAVGSDGGVGLDDELAGLPASALLIPVSIGLQYAAPTASPSRLSAARRVSFSFARVNLTVLLMAAQERSDDCAGVAARFLRYQT